MNNNTDKNKKLRDLYEKVMLPNYAPADFIPESKWLIRMGQKQ